MKGQERHWTYLFLSLASNTLSPSVSTSSTVSSTGQLSPSVSNTPSPTTTVTESTSPTTSASTTASPTSCVNFVFARFDSQSYQLRLFYASFCSKLFNSRCWLWWKINNNTSEIPTDLLLDRSVSIHFYLMNKRKILLTFVTSISSLYPIVLYMIRIKQVNQ